ncbi:TonB-dependent receptor [Sphingomonas soli]|uniref:TonB-dependent receptor n=1 Tax=Sphingomonas soli TaxID=266127 RepID=UPI00082EDB53|nr:TonB-dependent receptor [Sphingomonas soli]
MRFALFLGAATAALAVPAVAFAADPDPKIAPSRDKHAGESPAVPAAEDEQDQDHGHESADSGIIVTAPYVRSQVDVLSGTSVLSGEALTRQIKPTIGDTLASLPGVSASSFGPAVSRPVLRGFQGERIRILTDGIGSIDVSNTSADHAAAINPLNADRIEVLRGPAALLFGSSAIGGVVNVIDSRIPRRIPTEAVHLDLIGNYSSASEQRSAAGHLDVPLGNGIVAHADGSYLKTGDLRTGGYLYARNVRDHALAHAIADNEPELAEEASVRGRLHNTAARTWDAAGGLSIIRDGGSLGFAVSRYESLYGVPARFDVHDHGHGGGGGHDHEDVRLNVKQTRFDVRAEVETGGLFEMLRFRGAAADYRHDEIEPDGAIGTSFFNQGWEGRVELVQADRGGWRGAIGGQFLLRDFRVEGDEKFLPQSSTQQFGLFTLQSFDLGPLKAEAGARYEHSDIRAKADVDLGNPDIARRFDAFSFSLGASYALAPGIRIGLSGSRTERAPSAEEMFANGPHAGTQAFEIGDPGFAKESSWGLEASLKGQGDGYSFALSAYHNWFRNYIYDYQTGAEIDHLPVFQYAQADARYYGLEGELSVRLARLGGFDLNTDLVGDYVHADITGEGPAPRIPALRLLGGLEAQSDRLTTRVEVERVFDQKRIAGYETPTDGYTMVNASISWKPFATKALSLTLSANNLFDVEARRHASVLKDFAPLAGRDFRISARFQL